MSEEEKAPDWSAEDATQDPRPEMRAMSVAVGALRRSAKAQGDEMKAMQSEIKALRQSYVAHVTHLEKTRSELDAAILRWVTGPNAGVESQVQAAAVEHRLPGNGEADSGGSASDPTPNEQTAAASLSLDELKRERERLIARLEAVNHAVAARIAQQRRPALGID